MKKSKLVRLSFFVCSFLMIAACGGTSDNSNKDNETSFSTYKEALAANDFEAAHAILSKAETEHETMERNDFEKKYGLDYVEGLEKAKDEVFDREVKFLVANGSEEANARLVFLFSDFEIKGKRLPEGLNNYYDGSDNQYPQSVNDYNQKLDMVLDLAISLDNKELASKIIKLYKENMDVFKGGSSHSVDQANGITRYFEIAPDGTEVDGNHCYVTYNYKDKEAAQKKYEENFGKDDNKAE